MIDDTNELDEMEERRPPGKAVKEGVAVAEKQTAAIRPAPTTPDKTKLKEDYIAKRAGKRVTMEWSFAGSHNVHTGKLEGLATCSKGQSVMLTLDARETVYRDVIGVKEVNGLKGRKYTGLEYAAKPRYAASEVPLYVPLRAVLSLKEAKSG